MRLVPNEKTGEQVKEGAFTSTVSDKDRVHQSQGLAHTIKRDRRVQMVDEMAVTSVPEKRRPGDSASPVERRTVEKIAWCGFCVFQDKPKHARHGRDDEKR